MKNIKVDFFSESKKWPRRIPKIKIITKKTINKMRSYFKRDHRFELNIILTDKSKMIKLNKNYKNKQSDTDVLTFILENSNKNVGKILYCDIFFSIDTIEKFSFASDGKVANVGTLVQAKREAAGQQG